MQLTKTMIPSQILVPLKRWRTIFPGPLGVTGMEMPLAECQLTYLAGKNNHLQMSSATSGSNLTEQSGQRLVHLTSVHLRIFKNKLSLGIRCKVLTFPFSPKLLLVSCSFPLSLIAFKLPVWAKTHRNKDEYKGVVEDHAECKCQCQTQVQILVPSLLGWMTLNVLYYLSMAPEWR